jgi:oligopeptide/dipeptide ABC transporter ATP-binding protein
VSVGCQVRDLRVRALRRGTLLVDSTDLAVHTASIMGVVGETGAGKTVAMRALLGLLPSGVRAEGNVRIGDGPVIDLGDLEALRALLGAQTSVVLQNPVAMLDPLVRVGRQLVEGVVRRRRLSRAEAMARATALLARMGFEDPEGVQGLYPHQLSGGMAQRLVTAMAMMPRPRLLVLDEPTSALDANVRVDVLALLRSLVRDERSAVFLVSHDLGLVSHFCDSLAVMYAGRIVERGPAREILSAPAHPYTAALLASSASLTHPRREPLPVIAGSPPHPGRWPAGCVFEPRCPRRAALCRRERPVPAADGARSVACHFPRGWADG